jgi:predicted PolB exonuclease-like 3'-5' exonuclease
MAATDIIGKVGGEASDATAFLIFDTESVPDGRLIGQVKYPGETLTPAEAIERARMEARQLSLSGSDFLPVSFQYPVAVCILRVGLDFAPQAIKCLDAPQFRPQKIVEEFWRGLAHYKEKSKGRARFVTFNGRAFDWPLLELGAFRYGCCARDYFLNGRRRYGPELDLMEWLTNYGALRPAGVKLDVFAKLLGKPGKTATKGDQVYAMYLAGKNQEINDYCMFDTLDTYFVFLRTRVLEGQITLEQEQALVARAKAWIGERVAELPMLQHYLDNWGDWQAWP